MTLRSWILPVAALACCAARASPPPPISPIGSIEQWLLDADANRDGRIQRTEYESFLNMKFGDVDLNHDNKLTKNEFDVSIADADKNGVVSRPEYVGAGMAEFIDYDKNHDGYLTLGEERQFLADTALSQGDVNKMMDTDRNGITTRQEFNAYWKARFQVLDRNGDRRLSVDEMQGGGSPYWSTVLKIVDRDGDGADSYDEYMSFYGYRFANADKDRDGRLSASEPW